MSETGRLLLIYSSGDHDVWAGLAPQALGILATQLAQYLIQKIIKEAALDLAIRVA